MGEDQRHPGGGTRGDGLRGCRGAGCARPPGSPRSWRRISEGKGIPLRRLLFLWAVGGLLGACVASPPPPDPVAAPAGVLWDRLSELCGGAFEGRVVRDDPPTEASPFEGVRLVMHVRECSDSVIRIPFHVGDDRSRTWVLEPIGEGGLRLKHHHLHEDGTPDSIHFYGGDSAPGGTEEWFEFPADSFTAALLPAAATNVWTIEVVPGALFAYALRREGTPRRFRVEFDLTRPVNPPPPPWGAPPLGAEGSDPAARDPDGPLPR